MRAALSLLWALVAALLTGEFMAIWFAKGERLIRVNIGTGFEDIWMGDDQ